MKVRNASKSVIHIGSKAIKPDDVVEITKDEAKMSGVKALLESGELEIVRKEKNDNDK